MSTNSVTFTVTNTKSNLKLRARSPPKTVTWNPSPQVRVYPFESTNGEMLAPVPRNTCVPNKSYNSLHYTLPRHMAISSALGYFQNDYY